jgi:hypothetical protein
MYLPISSCVSASGESCHRYTTSAFLRLKLGKELGKRQLSPRVYETVSEAPENHSAK